MATYRKIYYCDNGALICEDHLGCSAKHTGRDISGQKIQLVGKSDVTYFSDQGLKLACERCGCEASITV